MKSSHFLEGGGRVVRWCWVNFQCRGVLLIRIRVGHGPTAVTVGAGGGCSGIFTLVYHLSFLSPSLWETAQYRLKYCLKGLLSPKQPTNQPTHFLKNYLDTSSLYMVTVTTSRKCMFVLLFSLKSNPTFCYERGNESCEL